MSLDLIRNVNGEIRRFLHHGATNGSRTAVIPTITARSLHALYERLDEVGKSFPLLEETEASPEYSEYEHNLTELKAFLEQAQVELAARRNMLQAHFAKLRSTSAWAQTLKQTR